MIVNGKITDCPICGKKTDKRKYYCADCTKSRYARKVKAVIPTNCLQCGCEITQPETGPKSRRFCVPCEHSRRMDSRKAYYTTHSRSQVLWLERGELRGRKYSKKQVEDWIDRFITGKGTLEQISGLTRSNKVSVERIIHVLTNGKNLIALRSKYRKNIVLGLYKGGLDSSAIIKKTKYSEYFVCRCLREGIRIGEIKPNLTDRQKIAIAGYNSAGCDVTDIAAAFGKQFHTFELNGQRIAIRQNRRVQCGGGFTFQLARPNRKSGNLRDVGFSSICDVFHLIGIEDGTTYHFLVPADDDWAKGKVCLYMSTKETNPYLNNWDVLKCLKA